MAAAELVAVALSLGLDTTAHAIAGGDVLERVFWTDRLSRAVAIINAREKAAG